MVMVVVVVVVLVGVAEGGRVGKKGKEILASA